MTQYQKPTVYKDMSSEAASGVPEGSAAPTQHGQDEHALTEAGICEQMLTPAERARREEYLQSINEARWFAAAFIGAVCVCFLVYIVL